MNKDSLRIVYMGTPDFAVEPLRVLVESGYRVVCVITMPDKPAGRGMKLRYSPVKEYAISKKIPLLQPEKLKDPEFLAALKTFKADLQIVVAFRMLPEVVWGMPPMGTFNLHASLLPQYRGAAPINWAVMNGEKETGVTTFFLQQAIDTGDLLLQEKIVIEPDECVGSVHDKLMVLGGRMVLQTVNVIMNGSVNARPQNTVVSDESVLKSAPKLFKENTRIDWKEGCESLHNFIRGLSPFPSAWSELHSNEGEIIGVKIFEAGYVLTTHDLAPGTLVSDGKKELKVAVNGGFILLKRFQLAGRKALSTDEFLRGFTKISDFFFV